MLRHIGIHIYDEDEIEHFYKNILRFEVVKSYPFYPEAAEKLFSTNEPVQVYRLQRFEVKLKVFVCPKPFNPGLSHLALEYWKAHELIEKAKNAGYAVIEFEKRPGKKGYFLKDKAGNIFEIKQINFV